VQIKGKRGFTTNEYLQTCGNHIAKCSAWL